MSAHPAPVARPLEEAQSPWTPHRGLAAQGCAEWLIAIAAKMEAGGAGLGPFDRIAGDLRQTAETVRIVAGALAKADAEAAALREQLAEAQANYERGLEHRNDLMDSVVSLRTRATAAEQERDTAREECTRLREENQRIRETLKAKAEIQLAFWRKRMAAEKSREDGVSEDGMTYTPIGDDAAWSGGYCNGRLSEADWWRATFEYDAAFKVEPPAARSALSSPQESPDADR